MDDEKRRYAAAAKAIGQVLSAYDIREELLFEAAKLAVAAKKRVRPDRDAVIELASKGVSFSEIAQQLGISKTAAHAIAKDDGISRGGSYDPGVEWTEEMNTTLAGLIRSGMSQSLIASRFGVTRGALHNQVRRLGLVGVSRSPVVRKRN